MDLLRQRHRCPAQNEMAKITLDPYNTNWREDRMYFKVSKSDTFEPGWYTMMVGKNLLSLRLRRLMHLADLIYLVDQGEWTLYARHGFQAIKGQQPVPTEIEKSEIILSAQEIY